MVPRQMRETLRPVRPRSVNCIVSQGAAVGCRVAGVWFRSPDQQTQRLPDPAVSVSDLGAERLSRTGRSSTGLDVLHSSHQCRCELDRRFRIPQLSQTKTSFLTSRVLYVEGDDCQTLFAKTSSSISVSHQPVRSKNRPCSARFGHPKTKSQFRRLTEKIRDKMPGANGVRARESAVKLAA